MMNSDKSYLSRGTAVPTRLHVGPGTAQISQRIHSLICAHVKSCKKC